MRDADMECNEQSDRDILKSIIAMLFSFAVMAEGIANRSYFVRCYMLWVLRRAEASALRCIGMEGSSQWTLHRNSRADALRMAEAFREVARLLDHELREEERLARWWARSERTEPGGDDPFALPAIPVRQCTIRAVWFSPNNLTCELKACRVLPPP